VRVTGRLAGQQGCNGGCGGSRLQFSSLTLFGLAEMAANLCNQQAQLERIAQLVAALQASQIAAAAAAASKNACWPCSLLSRLIHQASGFMAADALRSP